MTPHARDIIHRQHLELQRALALLADTIASAERWYARQEAELAAFDRRANDTVCRLRNDGWVDPSVVWHPAGTVAAAA